MIIIEGIDGVGKTTLVEYLCKEKDFIKFHFDYDVNNMNLKEKYLKILDLDNLDKLVLDRSFISEMVYGPVVRDKCKLTIEEYIYLLNEYKKIGAQIIYLVAPKQVLLDRRKIDDRDYSMIDIYYEELNKYYENMMEISREYINVDRIDTYLNVETEVQDKVRKLLK